MEHPKRAGLLDIQAAAGYLSVKRTTLYRLIAEGQVASVHIGARHLVPIEALEAFVEKLQAQDVVL